MNKTESERRRAGDGEFNDEMSSQLLNQQLWITGEEVMPRGGGDYRLGNTSPGESLGQDVAGHCAGVLEVLCLLCQLAHCNSAKRQRSKAGNILCR